MRLYLARVACRTLGARRMDWVRTYAGPNWDNNSLKNRTVPGNYANWTAQPRLNSLYAGQERVLGLRPSIVAFCLSGCVRCLLHPIKSPRRCNIPELVATGGVAPFSVQRNRARNKHSERRALPSLAQLSFCIPQIWLHR
jgi:hypothetical protein